MTPCTVLRPAVTVARQTYCFSTATLAERTEQLLTLLDSRKSLGTLTDDEIAILVYSIRASLCADRRVAKAFKVTPEVLAKYLRARTRAASLPTEATVQ